MVMPPALHGMNCKPYPLISEDYWIDAEHNEKQITEWKRMIKDPMSSLFIDEKYAEVEIIWGDRGMEI